MRYYDITISVPANASSNAGKTINTGNGLGFTYGTGGTTFTSLLATGYTNPAALQIEFDVPVSLAHQPSGSAWIRVWGVGLPMLSQASQLAGMNIVIRAGMTKGLPLANPAQSGIVLEGLIFQSFGNWQGTNQTLEIVFNPQVYQPQGNVNWSWAPNTPIQDALTLTTSQAFAGYSADVSNVTASLQRPDFDGHACKNFTEFHEYLQRMTKPLGAKITGDSSYPGVWAQLNSASKTIIYYDNINNLKTVKTLNFQDLIGQPTWVEPGTVNFQTVLRSDLNIGNTIMFPQGVQQPFALTQTVAAPGSPVSSRTAFQGTFQIARMQHFANFRQPDAASWNTSFDANYNYPSGADYN